MQCLMGLFSRWAPFMRHITKRVLEVAHAAPVKHLILALARLAGQAAQEAPTAPCQTTETVPSLKRIVPFLICWLE